MVWLSSLKNLFIQSSQLYKDALIKSDKDENNCTFLIINQNYLTNLLIFFYKIKNAFLLCKTLALHSFER